MGLDLRPARPAPCTGCGLLTAHICPWCLVPVCDACFDGTEPGKKGPHATGACDEEPTP